MTRFGASLTILLSCLAFGCGGKSDVKPVDVAGTISMDGKPLSGVEVYFASDKFEGYGKTDEKGKYRLVNGAVAGTNKVYLKKFDTTNVAGIDKSIPGMDDGQAAAMMEAQSRANTKGGPASGSLIPPEYSDVKTTKLTFSVPEAGTEAADFRISSGK